MTAALGTDVHQVFFSFVIIAQNREQRLKDLLQEASCLLSGLVSDFEIVVVDNGSTDNTAERLAELTKPDGLSDLQVFILTNAVDPDSAAWVGIENSLGDFVVVFDPACDDLAMVPAMIDEAMKGAHVVFVSNTNRPNFNISYRVSRWAFAKLSHSLGGIDATRDIPKFRLLSRQVANYVQQHPVPVAVYRWLPTTSGFPKVSLKGSWTPTEVAHHDLLQSIEAGLQILMSTTRVPMRLVTLMSLFGAFGNLLYSLYVIAVGLFKPHVAQGWITLSLQQSGMFFLISLVLLVLGEYMLRMSNQSIEGLHVHVAREYTSAVLTRRAKLNVVDPLYSGIGAHNSQALTQ